MAGLSTIKKFPGLSTLFLLEFVLLITVSHQIQVDTNLSLLEKVGLMVFGPIQEINNRLAGSISESMAEKKTRLQLEKENGQLKRALAGHEQLVTDLAEVELENERLRTLLRMPKEENWETIAAEVIGATQRRNDFMITINKGSSSGVRRDYGVACPEGIVGIVWEVSFNYAKVMTVPNPSSVVACMVQDTRHNESYVSGLGATEGRNRIRYKGRIHNFPNFQSINPHDLILTSGLDGLFPKGLYIGRVTSGRPAAHMFQNVEIEFSADFSSLEEVVVLVPQCREESP
jgi:rod shape-determining protein MreC